MGKGRIVGAHGDGRYTIEIVEDRARADAVRARAEQLVAEVSEQIAQGQTELGIAQGEVDTDAEALQAAILAYHDSLGNEDGNDSEKAAMQEANARLLATASRRDEVRARISSLKLRRTGLQSRIDRINKLPPLRQMDAWCADYSENLSGEVATAEVPGEVGQVLIRPGFDDGAAWNASRDGAIQPVLSSTPAATFYNLALLPGWQKWRPTYRIATVSNIDNDLCDITLDVATSSQQGLNVNAQTHYSGVPIMYMDCNGDAFEEGDRALVAFSGSTDKPMVVGFESEPRQCVNRLFVMFEAVVLSEYLHLVAANEEGLPSDIENWENLISRAGTEISLRTSIKVNNPIYIADHIASILTASNVKEIPVSGMSFDVIDDEISGVFVDVGTLPYHIAHFNRNVTLGFDGGSIPSKGESGDSLTLSESVIIDAQIADAEKHYLDTVPEEYPLIRRAYGGWGSAGTLTRTLSDLPELNVYQMSSSVRYVPYGFVKKEYTQAPDDEISEQVRRQRKFFIVEYRSSI